jgi:hypothetical protein
MSSQEVSATGSGTGQRRAARARIRRMISQDPTDQEKPTNLRLHFHTLYSKDKKKINQSGCSKCVDILIVKSTIRSSPHKKKKSVPQVDID